jgi:hypothetical protein
MLDRGYRVTTHKPLKPMQRARLEAQADAIGTAIEILIHGGNFSAERSESLARVRGEAPPAAEPVERIVTLAEYGDGQATAPRLLPDGSLTTETPSPAAEYGAFRVAWRTHDGALHHGGEGQDWNEDRATAAADKLKAAGFRFWRDRRLSGAAWIEHQDPTTKEWRQW